MGETARTRRVSWIPVLDNIPQRAGGIIIVPKSISSFDFALVAPYLFQMRTLKKITHSFGHFTWKYNYLWWVVFYTTKHIPFDAISDIGEMNLENLCELQKKRKKEGGKEKTLSVNFVTHQNCWQSFK